MNLESLNPMQKEAVMVTKGPVLVVAGAGSGKTRVLTYRIARLIENEGVFPSNILAITFTNKASKEMKERVEKLVGDDALSQMWVGTFHAISVRILRRHHDVIGFDRDFVIYDTQDQKAVIKACYKELNIDDKLLPMRKTQYKISNAKNEMLTADLYEKQYEHDFTEEDFIKIYKLYQEKLIQSNAMDFDDLLLNAIKVLKRSQETLSYYQQKFKYIHVDEYQDTNKAQYLLIRMLGDYHNNVFVVGDGDQSIYKWRGADIRNIREFEKDFKESKIIKLEQNYRSSKNILDVANSVIENNIDRRKKDLWTQKEPGEKIGYYMAFDEEEESRFVVNKIRQLVNSEQYKKQEIAILYRTNAQSRAFEKKLLKENIAYKIIGGLKFFDRKEIKDMMAYLRVVVNPEDTVSFNRIINEPKRGLGVQSLEKINTYARENQINQIDACFDVSNMDMLSGKAQKGLREFCEIIKTINGLKEQTTSEEILDVLIEMTGYIKMLENEGTQEADNRIDNIYELKKEFVEFHLQNPDLLLRDFLADASLKSDADGIEDDYDTVTLMTVHAAKGLEYPVVFLVGLENNLFPSYMSDDEEEMEEERRLCYVGITRAEELLFVSHANRRNKFGSWENMTVSQFIKEMPEEKLQLLSEKGYYNCEEKTEEFLSVYENATQKKENPYKLELVKEKRKKKKESVMKKAVIDVIVNEKVEAKKEEKVVYKEGQIVKTRAFGKGKILSIDGKPGSEQLTISFDTKGIKKLQVGFVPITIIEA